MQEEKFSFSGSFQKIREYVDTQVELLKLRAIAKSARIFAALTLDATKLLLVLLIAFFWSLALGFYLGELFGSYSLGFLATGGIFLILILIINLTKKRLELLLMDGVIRKILSKLDEEDEHLETDLKTRLKREAEQAERKAQQVKEKIEELDNEYEQGS